MTANPTRLVLASRSAIRQQLLRAAGVVFDVDAADIDEAAIGAATKDAASRAALLAREKALATAARHPSRVVLGADQVGQLDDGTFLEKPRDASDHLRLLWSMRGRSHTFHPAFALVRDQQVLAEGGDRVTVWFRDFAEESARALVERGEGRFSCGGYESENGGVQLIDRIDGSAAAVLGLPILAVLDALRAVQRSAGVVLDGVCP